MYISSCFESQTLGELSQVSGSHWGAPSSWRSGASFQLPQSFLAISTSPVLLGIQPVALPLRSVPSATELPYPGASVPF